MFEVLSLLAPFLALGIIGKIGSFLGDAAGALGDIPVVGDVLGSPIAQAGMGLIPGIGPIGAAAMGALGGLQGDGGVQGALGGAAKGFGAQQLMETFQQQRADSERARELTEQAMQRGDQASDIALQQHQLDAPLRQGFRQGALNFHDPTNPFSQGPMPMQPEMQQAPAAQPAMAPTQPQPTPGSISQRVAGLLNRGSLGRGGMVHATPDFNPSAGGAQPGPAMPSPLVNIAQTL